MVARTAIVIGPNGNGKTTLVHKITNDARFSPSPAMRPQQAERSVWRGPLPGYPNVDLSIMDTDGYGNGNANDDQNNSDLVQRVRALPKSMFHIALLVVQYNTRTENGDFQSTINQFVRSFGASMIDHMLLVFTNADADAAVARATTITGPDTMRYLEQQYNHRPLGFVTLSFDPSRFPTPAVQSEFRRLCTFIEQSNPFSAAEAVAAARDAERAAERMIHKFVFHFDVTDDDKDRDSNEVVEVKHKHTQQLIARVELGRNECWRDWTGHDLLATATTPMDPSSMHQYYVHVQHSPNGNDTFRFNLHVRGMNKAGEPRYISTTCGGLSLGERNRDLQRDL